MATLPGALALASIADGALAVAADLRNNYAAVQTYANDLRTLLAGGASGDVLTSGSGTTVSWAPPVSSTIYRKTTSKTVNTTTAATDLLNGEITIAAGVMSTNKTCRLTAWGDLLWNVGAVNIFRLQLVLGGTTLIDTGVSTGAINSSATRGVWKVQAEILNLGAANSQMTHLTLNAIHIGGFSSVGEAAFTTGQGWYAMGGSGGMAARTILGQAINPSTALDTSTSKTLVLNVINGSASASYETKLLGALVEIV